MARIKVTIDIEEEFEYSYRVGDERKTEIRTRDRELYKQTVERNTDVMINKLISDIAQIVNGI